MQAHINHESSRKAFETLQPDHIRLNEFTEISITNLAERHLRRVTYDIIGIPLIDISITNLAERHLRPLPLGELCHLSVVRISITNLAERHLRLLNAFDKPSISCTNINHESSRKAFETRHARPGTTLISPISITNLAERHLRPE